MRGACFLTTYGQVCTSVTALKSDEQDSKFFALPNPPIVVKSCLHPVISSIAFAYQEAGRQIRVVKPCGTGNCSGQEGAERQQSP